MIRKVTRWTSGAAILLALAMLVTTAPAFARGGNGGGGGGGGGGSAHRPSAMYPVNPPAGSSATIGWTTSRGFGSATLRITANLPVPAACAVPYSVLLDGTTLTTPATTPINITTYLASLGKTNPRVLLPAGSTGAPYCSNDVWYYPNSTTVIPTGTLVEWAYNQDFAKGFVGTARIINTATGGTTLYAYPNPATSDKISLPVRINPNKGSGD